MRLSRPSTKAMFHPEKKLCFVHTCQILFVLPDIYPSHSTRTERCELPKGRWSTFERHPGSYSAGLSQGCFIELGLVCLALGGRQKYVFLSAPAPGDGCSGQQLKSQVPREDISGSTAVSESYRTLLLERCWEAREQHTESYKQALLPW